jgi:hypothetical protein
MPVGRGGGIPTSPTNGGGSGGSGGGQGQAQRPRPSGQPKAPRQMPVWLLNVLAWLGTQFRVFGTWCKTVAGPRLLAWWLAKGWPGITRLVGFCGSKILMFLCWIWSGPYRLRLVAFYGYLAFLVGARVFAAKWFELWLSKLAVTIQTTWVIVAIVVVVFLALLKLVKISLPKPFESYTLLLYILASIAITACIAFYAPIAIALVWGVAEYIWNEMRGKKKKQEKEEKDKVKKP